MEKRINVRGIKHMKSHYKKVSFNQYKKMYEGMDPYCNMKAIDREQALLEDWRDLGGSDEVEPINNPVKKFRKND